MVCLIILRRSRVGHPRVAIKSVVRFGFGEIKPDGIYLCLVIYSCYPIMDCFDELGLTRQP